MGNHNKINKKSCISALIIATLLQGNALAAEKEKKRPLGQINDYLRIKGHLQGSYEAWNYFQPSPAVNNNNQYDLWGVRARLGLELKSDYVDGYVEGQYLGAFGVPDDSISKPGGALGLGGAYFALTRSTSPENTFLRQAYLTFKADELGLKGLSLKLGRFEYMDGMEYKTGNRKFDMTKRKRIAQRLLGTYVVYMQRTFDGFSLSYDQPDYNFTASGFRPTQGGFNVQGQHEISDVNVFYTALTSKKDALLKGTEGRLFYMYYNDDRQTKVTDNRSAANRPSLETHNLELHTLGAHALTQHKVGSGTADALMWGAYQFGDWTNQDHSAWAFDAEVSYQWDEVPLKPSLRAVYYTSSGDDNPNDNQHNTFFLGLPSGRAFAKFPFYNMMNIQDTFVELSLTPIPKSNLTFSFHQLTVNESNDLFYGGHGATSRSGAFGYMGRPTNGNTDIGQLVDVNFTHRINEHISWRVYYGHAFGGSVTESFYKGKKDADLAYMMVNLEF
ncbi:MAG: hypothetical protein GQ569_14760 [Methylococcaceae bacterium]|nr:hypothetical protein [Methylococcaceae bacterium]